MILIDIVMANIAADEMGLESWPYDLALALVKVKKATTDDAAFFVSKERDLALKYAALDETGNLRLTQNGTFIFKNPAEAGDYESARSALSDTETPAQIAPIRVKPPVEIRPAWISALEGFIEFTG